MRCILTLAYEVTRQFSYGTEKVIARFAEANDADEFMEVKADRDHKTKVASVYRLYNMGEKMKEIDAITHESSNQGAEQSAGAAQRFSPSPLSTTPKPAGFTSSFKNNPNDDDDLV